MVPSCTISIAIRSTSCVLEREYLRELADYVRSNEICVFADLSTAANGLRRNDLADHRSRMFSRTGIDGRIDRRNCCRNGGAARRRPDGLESRSGVIRIQFDERGREGTFAERQVLNTFGCTGGNQSPQLSWTGVPAGAQSFALTMFDPDAPTGSGWWHWIVVNIPVSATELPPGASGNQAKMPAGSQETRTDFGKPGYGGPCPPPGAPHRYVFTLYALKVPKLDLDSQASGAMASFTIRQNSLASATFTARYSRK
jgi:Raf kinase inhibitor-like YbhB/YbcL family protein